MPSTPLGTALPLGQSGSGRRRGASVKTLKRVLKKAGLKTSGRKAALTRRAKKAHLKVGGGDPMEGMEGARRRRHRGGEEVVEEVVTETDGGRRRRSRRGGNFKLY
jgi:hypothetical protein